MKAVFLLIILALLTSCKKGTTNKNNKNDLGSFELMGKVKSIETHQYKPKVLDGIIAKGEIDNNWLAVQSLNEFNHKGNILKTTIFKDNKENSVLTYSYDGEKLIEKNSKFGRWLSEEGYYPRDSMIYGRNGLIESIIRFDDSLKYIRNKRTYNKKNLLTIDSVFDKSNEVDEIENFEYDSVGNILEKKNTLFGKNITISNFSVYKYDTLSRKIESRFYRYGALDRRWVSEYNEFDDILKEIKYYSEGSTVEYSYKYVYEYDDQKNWITKIVFKNDEPTEYLKRKIIYY